MFSCPLRIQITTFPDIPRHLLLVLAVECTWMLGLHPSSHSFLWSWFFSWQPYPTIQQPSALIWALMVLHFQPSFISNQDFPSYFSSAFSTAGWIPAGISNQRVYSWVIFFWLKLGSSITISILVILSGLQLWCLLSFT